ncbi:MAG: DUF2232 domain-containing protein [Vicinamibacteria bacterium]
MNTQSVRADERHEPRGGGVFGASLTASLLFGAALIVPWLAALASAAPFPLLVLRLRKGAFSSAVAAGLATALVAGIFTPGQGLVFLAFLAVPGLLIAEAMARGRGLLRGCRWAFLWLTGLVSLALLFAGPQLVEPILEQLQRYHSQEFLDGMRSSGLPAERVDDWAEQVTTLTSVMQVVYPAAFLILAAMVVLVNAALLRSWLARRDPGWLDGGEFETLRFPLGLVVAFVLAGGSLALPAARPTAYNALLLVAFFFALQGLAVVSYYAHRLAGPPILRVGLMVLVLINPWAPQILALLGLFDTWFDFRKWADPPPADEA